MQRSSLVSAAAVLAAQLSLPAQAGEGHAHGEGAADGMPRLSLVLDTQYARDNQGGEAHEIIEEAAGILHGEHFHEDDHGQENGFGLGASELALEADLPSQLKARVSLALNVDEIELEEAWVQTQGLPSGLSVKAGRFLSGIGYLNGQHPHEQDFANGNLVYTALLGPHGVLDTGVQLTWQAPVPFFLMVGAEALQGHEQERFGTLVEAEEADAALEAAGGRVFRRHRSELAQAWLEHDVAAFQSEIGALESEASIATGEAKVRLQTKLAAAKIQLDGAVHRAGMWVETLKREADTKAAALKRQWERSDGSAKRRVEERAQRVKDGYHARGAKLSQAWGLMKEALAI